MKIHGNPIMAIACDSGIADVKAGTIPSADTRIDVQFDYIWTGGEVPVPFPLKERSLIHFDSMGSVTFNCIAPDQPTSSPIDPYSRPYRR